MYIYNNKLERNREREKNPWLTFVCEWGGGGERERERGRRREREGDFKQCMS